MNKDHQYLRKKATTGWITSCKEIPMVYLIINIQITFTSPHGQGSSPGLTMWDLWWAKWHWDFSHGVGVPLSATIRIMLHIYSLITWAWHSRPIGSCEIMEIHLYQPQEFKKKIMNQLQNMKCGTHILFWCITKNKNITDVKYATAPTIHMHSQEICKTRLILNSSHQMYFK